MIAILLDTETQGTDPTVHKPIEIAAMRFDLARACPLSSFSTLLRAEGNPAAATNGIPADVLVDAPPPEMAWKRLQAMAAGAHVILAHNAEFDRAFVPDLGIPWACTMNDVAWGRCKPGTSLVNLALSYGVGVASAHRAMTDVDTLSRVLMRAHELGNGLAYMVTRALRPKVKIVGRQSRDENDVAKANGFRWNPDAKEWWRMMPAEDAMTLPFKWEVHDASPPTPVNHGGTR